MPIKKSELYSSLWQSCDELRGGMDASQYKDYVLVLLFIKYVSDKYAGQPYAPITIPPGAGFKDMVALKGTSDIGDQINKKIIAPLAAANKLSDFPDFNDPSKLGDGKDMVERLTNLIAIFENKALDFSKNRADGADIQRIKHTLEHYLDMREIVRKASGESLDLKAYEADMRHLIDTYIEADEPRKISPFDNIGLLELIVKTGIANAVNTQLGGLKGDKNAIAETIENNVRRKIIKEHLNDPAYYEKMSALLDEIIAARKARAIEYEEYLKQVAALANQVETGHADDTPPRPDTPGKRALWNNLRQDESLALAVHETVQRVKPDDFRGVQAKENTIKAALLPLLVYDQGEVERIFRITNEQKGEY